MLSRRAQVEHGFKHHFRHYNYTSCKGIKYNRPEEGDSEDGYFDSDAGRSDEDQTENSSDDEE